ncbi:hypothetical protein HaLaN_00777 [Haematococcus lacustris]|uniref:Uncharacterized protein n=1 Tax=Haematococcus lacustris TaxID=44745 RepID=A0A699Y7N7_HAELA|nr:hypothetical protein HaLaN_00777 [Haematococcus lacustris]
MKDAVLQLAGPAYTSQEQPAAASTSAGELCTLLLTDQEVLDVVLALHDIRTAQLCHLLSWPGSHALKLPPPSEALAKQLSQSQRSVPGRQLLPFVTALEGDPLLRVWDSMHRAMLLVLAALQLSRHHMDTTLSQDPGQARLHATLPGLLLGLSTAVTVMQAAGQREADALRLLLL